MEPDRRIRHDVHSALWSLDVLRAGVLAPVDAPPPIGRAPPRAEPASLFDEALHRLHTGATAPQGGLMALAFAFLFTVAMMLAWLEHQQE
jgi:hypothetical protein